MRGLYLALLLFSLSGLATLDYRFKLAFFKYPVRTFKIITTALVVFILWDIAGIVGHMFSIGDNNLLLGIRIGEFPLEEIFFLLLLNYSSLILYLLFKMRIKS